MSYAWNFNGWIGLLEYCIVLIPDEGQEGTGMRGGGLQLRKTLRDKGLWGS